MTRPARNKAATPNPKLGNRLAPPRFLLFLALLPIVGLGYAQLCPQAPWKDVAVVTFDLAAAIFLLSLLPLLRGSDAAAMRLHSRENDANRGLVLITSTLMALAVMSAISGELDAAKGGDGLAMAKLIATLALIWLFANSVYALHYAHAFYAGSEAGRDDRGGIDFPGTTTPDYLDFAYFSFTLGMTFQTSDVQIIAPSVRRVVLLHTLAAFVFNIGVIAFTINALGGK